MNDDPYLKIIIQICHDLASCLTAVQLGLDAKSLDDEVIALLKESTHRGVAYLHCFRSLFDDTSWYDVERFCSFIAHQGHIQINHPLPTLDPKTVLGMLYLCFKGLPRGGIIQPQDLGFTIKGNCTHIDTSSPILGYLKNHNPYIVSQNNSIHLKKNVNPL